MEQAETETGQKYDSYGGRKAEGKRKRRRRGNIRKTWN